MYMFIVPSGPEGILKGSREKTTRDNVKSSKSTKCIAKTQSKTNT